MSVYVGIDVHRKRSQVAVVTEDGTVELNKNVVNGSEASPATPRKATGSDPSCLLTPMALMGAACSSLTGLSLPFRGGQGTVP